MSKCFDGSLTEQDFSIETGNNTTDKSLKGSIRRKISVLPNISGIFSTDPVVEEDFHKNRVYCTFAAGMSACTLGYIRTEMSYPETLLKGNQVKNGVHLDLVLRRKSGSKRFNGIVSETDNSLLEHFSDIKDLISAKMVKKVLNIYVKKYAYSDLISDDDWKKIESAYQAYKENWHFKDADCLYQFLKEKRSDKSKS